MNARRNVLFWLVLMWIFPWVAEALIIWSIDPYHIFHETRWNKNLWFGSQSLLNLGQIETYLKPGDYDSVLLGSSHSMNFKGSDLAKAVGAKGVLKLCNGNQSMGMCQQWLNRSIASGHLKHVFIIMDAWCWLSLEKQDDALETVKPYVAHPWLCLWNPKCLRSVPGFYIIPRHWEITKNERFHPWDHVDDIHNWFSQREKYFARWIQPKTLALTRKEVYNFEHYCITESSMTSLLVKNRMEPLLHVIRTHPSIQFHVMIAPNCWTVYRYIFRWLQRTLSPTQIYDAFFFGTRHLITTCADLPNVKIYGWHDCAFVSNLANSCDSDHYHPDINRYMAWCIEHDKHRLTKENYDAYEARCVGNLRAFKILDSYPHRDTFDELVAAEMPVTFNHEN